MPSNSALARIHIAKKELALTEDAYRDLLREGFGVDSAKQLTERQALALIDRMKAKGWQPKPAVKPRVNPDFITVQPGPHARQQRKVLALWNALGYPMAKLHARVKTQFGVERFEWLTRYESLHILITDLEKRLATAGRGKKDGSRNA